jgi:hypothetical protein
MPPKTLLDHIARPVALRYQFGHAGSVTRTQQDYDLLTNPKGKHQPQSEDDTGCDVWGAEAGALLAASEVEACEAAVDAGSGASR